LANFISINRKFPRPPRSWSKSWPSIPAIRLGITNSPTPIRASQKFDEAERLLQRSIWLDATSTGPYILLGKVLLKKGETQLAVRALQRAVSMDPNNNIPHHLLGQAYRDLGRAEDAERELKLAEQLQSRESSQP
jgi:Flp pilus assembly protein TadD